MNWSSAFDFLKPYIVRIECTGGGYGTGFLYMRDDLRYGIATALHVLKPSREWNFENSYPIRISSVWAQESIIVERGQANLVCESNKDSAVLFVDRLRFDALKFPSEDIPLVPTNGHLRIGTEIGWIGFPQVQPDFMCFFAGHISSHFQEPFAYFLDALVIKGVSGGPMFYIYDGKVIVAGLIAKYLFYSHRGTALPGVSFAQDASFIAGERRKIAGS